MWTDGDVALALAYERWLAADQAEVCTQCGTRDTDWKAADGALLERYGMEAAWTVDVVECEGCRQIAAAQEQERGLDESMRAGRHIVLRRPAGCIPAAGDDVTDGR